MFDYDAWLEAPYTDSEDELDCDECDSCDGECSAHEDEDAKEAYEEHKADEARGK